MASGGRESNLYSSDDDETIYPTGRRRRKPRAIVSTDSDDSDFENKPKKLVRPLAYDSDEENVEYNNNTSCHMDKRICSNPEDDVSSLNDLSDNEQSEKCAICLSRFCGQDIATPEACDHMFCLACLQEWAKNVNTCPIDRLKFNLILIRHPKEEKIIKRIFVNSPESPWLTESESESNQQAEMFCGACGEHENEEALFPCNVCVKYFHVDCLNPSYYPANAMQCPNCTSYVRVTRAKSTSRHASLHSSRSHSLSNSHDISYSRNCHFSNRRLWRLHQKTQELIQRLKRHRRVITSSDSSDEEADHTTRSSVRLYEDRISPITKTSCQFLKKRRDFFHLRNQTLISSTASTTVNSSVYSIDFYDEANELGFENTDSISLHHQRPSTTTSISTSVERRIVPQSSENFDLVGSILESQSLLHSSDVLTLKRDGSLLLNSETETSHRRKSASVSSSSASSSSDRFSPQKQTYFESSRSNSGLPYSGDIIFNQTPLNPSQNTNSKYKESPKENHSCNTSSASSIETSVDYNSVNISSRSNVDNSGNEKFNDNSSTVIHKNFCSASLDDIKKVSNCKEPKSHHSEDEVDIYSDIESVGEDEGVCNTIENITPQMDSIKLPFKDEESPVSNPEGASDSSDNELIIDEDLPAEEENENPKMLVSSGADSNGEVVKQQNVNESEESVSSSPDVSDRIHQNLKSLKVNEKKSHVNNQPVENNQVFEESSQEASSNHGNFETEAKENIDSSEKKNALQDFDEKNGSECNDKNEYEVDKTSDVNEDKNVSDGEDQESEMDVDIDGGNSTDGLRKSPRNGNDTPHSNTLSPKQFSETAQPEKDENNCDSILSENEESCEVYSNVDSKKDEGMQEDENMNDMSSNISMQDNENMNDISSNISMQDNENMNDISSNISMQDNENMNDVSSNISMQDNENMNDMSSNISMQDNENTNDMSSNFSTQGNENTNMSNFEGNNSQAEPNSNTNFKSVLDKQDKEVLSNGCINRSDLFIDGETVDKCNVVVMKSVEVKAAAGDEDSEDNADSLENASTPCLDENIHGQMENSPVQNDTLECIGQDHKDLTDRSDVESKSNEIPLSTKENETLECGRDDEQSQNENTEDNFEKIPENADDLGIEDISEAGSGDLDDDFGDDNVSFTEHKKYTEDNGENDSFSQKNDDKHRLKHESEDTKYHNVSHNSNMSCDEHEEGEIIEERPVHHSNRKRSKSNRYDETDDYGELAPPRMSISELPRIPKLKRDRDKDSVPHEVPVETKRTSVLGRVDLGGGDISWKRLSKHTKERSYRDGRPKDERTLYREREARKKDRSYSNENDWRNDSKSSRRDDRKQESEKSRNEYDSRNKKHDKGKESKIVDWSYSDREKRKSHKDKHKEKHTKDKKDKKHDKSKHSKDDSKYSREKVKDDDHYDREFRYEKEERFERIVYEKAKFKEKEHKTKHKDRKGDSKSIKEHTRDKHKHIHIDEHFSDKQREREVRKIDDKLKIVVEQKEGRKEKSKHKEKKEPKHEKKKVHHHEHRKKETERSPYTELASIESKEIFAKGDSIIINVNFNRNSSPKDSVESVEKDAKSLSEEYDLDEVVTNTEKSKCKHTDKIKKPNDVPAPKRPVTPPERTAVLSVSECYWQGGEDSDANESQTSEKSVAVAAEAENETVESNDAFEGDNFSNSCNSVDVSEMQVADNDTPAEDVQDKTEKIPEASFAVEAESIVPSKRRSPRSPSPPSPADNDSYDPCEPTKSPSPPPMPSVPPLPTGNPKPPPSPELPPLPLEPEPVDNIREESVSAKIASSSSEFSAITSASVSTSSQTNTVHSQTSLASSMSLPGMLLPPPSFMSHASSTTNSLASLASFMQPSNFNFQVNSHPGVMFSSNHVQNVMHGIVSNQLHATSAIPPPPNPPSLPHMGTVPPPPPPPSAMALISSVRHSQPAVRPSMPTNSLLQSLTLRHPVTVPQLQLSHLHLPPSLSSALNNHQSPLILTSQTQSVSLPLSNQNPLVLSQSQMSNHSAVFQNQNNNKQVNALNNLPLQPLPNNTTQKNEKLNPTETIEVVDMEVDSPYSPGDSPSLDSGGDYSPTASPAISSPKGKDIFDSLLPSDHRTSDKRAFDNSTKVDKSKRSEPKGISDLPAAKKAKHAHKLDTAKMRHAVRLQYADKNKSRKEQRLSDKKLDDSQLKILDDLPSSAVEMQVKEKFLKKLNRQERVIEEVKIALKPYYKCRDLNKEEYKDILRKSVPKICHNRSGDINPVKVKALVECYVKKVKHSRKKDKKKSKS